MSDSFSANADVPQDSFLIAREAVVREDTVMQDEEVVPVTQRSSTAAPSTETQQMGDAVAGSHETRFNTPEAPQIEVLLPEVPPLSRPVPSMDPPETLTPEDMAMQRNPMVTASPSMVNPQLAQDTTAPSPDHSQHDKSSRVPELPQDTSVTGWLVPPAAEQQTVAEPPPSSSTAAVRETTAVARGSSKISFDGACSSFALLQLLSQQYYSVQYEIETFLQLTRVFRHLMLWNSDYLTLSEITFEWGDSYDDKDWTRLSAILAPTLMVDYTEVNGHKWDAMPATDFVGIMSHIGFVGDPLVHTQHHIGASKWQKISDDEVIGHHQLRAAHQRYTALDLKVVENKGHGHAMVKHFYKKVEGQWKLAGLRPTVRWNEFEFEKIFKGF